MSNFKPEFITASDMATRLNTTRQTICNLIKEGKIKAIKVGKSWRISIKEAERFEKEGVEVIDLDKEFIPVLMKCGHLGYGKTTNNKPYCVLCDCEEIATSEPNLLKRESKCIYCSRLTKSKITLPFFRSKPNEEYDSYYCGCGGWD